MLPWRGFLAKCSSCCTLEVDPNALKRLQPTALAGQNGRPTVPDGDAMINDAGINTALTQPGPNCGSGEPGGMKALAAHDCGTRRRRNLRARRRRARPAGRGRGSVHAHVGRRPRHIETRGTRDIRVRGRRIFAAATRWLMPFGPLDGVRRGCKRDRDPRAPLRCARPRPGSAAWSTPSASRSTARGRCRSGSSPDPLRGPPPPAHARAAGRRRRSISACGRSTPSRPAAAASAWASSPAPASASRCCCRCWRATSAPTSSSSAWSANAVARCRSSWRTISGRKGLPRSVVVVATSDEPALMRRQAAYLTLAIAEYFRDHGQDVCA